MRALFGSYRGQRARGQDARSSPIRVLPQHGPVRRLPSPRRENGVQARSLQGDVNGAGRGGRRVFAQQQGAGIAELRREATELVPGISLRQQLLPEPARHYRRTRRGRRLRTFPASRPSSFSQGCWFSRSSRGAGEPVSRPRIHARDHARVVVVERHVQCCSGRRVGGRIVRGGHVGLQFMLQVLGVFGRRRHMAWGSSAPPKVPNRCSVSRRKPL